MAHLAAGLRVIAELISPVMTHAPKEIFAQLGIKEDINLENLKFADVPAGVKAVAKGTPIFPRVDVDEEVDYIKQQMTKTDKAKGRAAMKEAAEAEFDPEETNLNLTKSRFALTLLKRLSLKLPKLKMLIKLRVLINYSNSVWMQVMMVIAKSSQELLNGILTIRN